MSQKPSLFSRSEERNAFLNQNPCFKRLPVLESLPTGFVNCSVCKIDFDGSSVQKLNRHLNSQPHVNKSTSASTSASTSTTAPTAASTAEHNTAITLILKDYPNTFKVIKDRFFCLQCHSSISTKRSVVTTHLKSKTHLKGVEITKANESTKTTTNAEFNCDLVRAMTATNAPLHILDNPAFKTFLEKWTCNQVKSSKTLRGNVLNKVEQNTFKKVKKYLKGKKKFISIDESTDKSCRSIASVMVGTLEAEADATGKLKGKPGKIFLFDVVKMKNGTADTIVELFDNTIAKLQCDPKEILLFATDGAAPMKAAGKKLCKKYKDMIHITCVAHALHRVAELISEEYPLATKLILSVKALYKSSHKRRRLFKKNCKRRGIKIKLPAAPVLTRWGTFLEACKYYASNFDVVEDEVRDLNGTTNVYLKAIDLFNNPESKNEILEIANRYSALVDHFEALQTRDMPTTKVFDLASEISNVLLEHVNNQKGNERASNIFKKWKEVVEKNVGLKQMEKIQKLQNNIPVPNQSDLPKNVKINLPYYDYAPMVTADVERSFSVMNRVYTHLRRNMKVSKLGTTMKEIWNAKVLSEIDESEFSPSDDEGDGGNGDDGDDGDEGDNGDDGDDGDGNADMDYEENEDERMDTDGDDADENQSDYDSESDGEGYSADDDNEIELRYLALDGKQTLKEIQMASGSKMEDWELEKRLRLQKKLNKLTEHKEWSIRFMKYQENLGNDPDYIKESNDRDKRRKELEERKKEQAKLNNADNAELFGRAYGLAKNDIETFKNDRDGYYTTLTSDAEAAAEHRNMEIEDRINRRCDLIDNSSLGRVLTKETHKVPQIQKSSNQQAKESKLINSVKSKFSNMVTNITGSPAMARAAKKTLLSQNNELKILDSINANSKKVLKKLEERNNAQQATERKEDKLIA